MGGLMIGELARQAQVNRETVRYYERRLLLPLPKRSASGYRVFSEDAVRRIKFIRRAHALGFSLSEIRELLELRASTRSQRTSARARAAAKIRSLDQKITALAAMKTTLTCLVRTCAEGGAASSCPILDGFDPDG